jgi:hypothetical protein
MQTKNFYLISVFAGIIALSLLTACTKYLNPSPYFENYAAGVDTQTVRKVLLITIDGAVGSAVDSIMPPVIASLLPHSKYTWNGLSEANTQDAPTWASIATGVRGQKHLIQDSSFLAVTTSPSQAPPFYPTFFYRIHQNNPATQTISITSWAALNNNLLIDADTRITPSSDLGVRDSAISHLKKDNAAFYSVDFRDVLTAGKNNAFTAANTVYKQAILQTDTYIGQLLDSLKTRKNYVHEQWLVIITTNHGGLPGGGGYGGNSLQERDIFALFYSPTVAPLELHGTYFNSVDFYGTTTSIPVGVTASANDSAAGIYGLGSGASMTVEMKVKMNPTASGSYWFGNWNQVFGKSKWGIYRNRGTTMSAYITDSSGHGIQLDVANACIDNFWHSFIVVMTMNKVNHSCTIKAYMDGALSKTNNDVGSSGTMPADITPLNLGGTGYDFNITDIRIYNKALSDGDIANDAISASTSSGDVNYSNLIGYWPAQDGGGIFHNQIQGNPDFILTGPYQYNVSNNTLPLKASNADILVENVTIAPEIFYWLGIPVQSSWGLDGTLIVL